MELWLSAEVQHDVSDALRLASNKIEPIINARLALDYGPAITEWALITILRPSIPDGWGEVWRYHRRRKVAEFRLIIDHSEFKSADARQHLEMLLASIERSIDLFPRLNVEGFDAHRFGRDIRDIALAEGWISA